MHLVILDAATLGDTSLSNLTQGFDKVSLHDHTPLADRAERLVDAQVVITNKVPIDANLMAICPQLQLICIAATGTDHVDLTAAKHHNITVTNVPAYSTDSVVSHTFALYFHLAHHNRYYDNYTRSSEWCTSPVFTHLGRPFMQLAGKTWAVIGMGQIGRGVAQVAAAFGCRIIYHSTSGRNLEQPYEHCDLKPLLSQADVVSIHAPLNDNTRNLIGSRELAWLQQHAILLNLGRGGIVDEGALAQALDGGHLAGAGLDVTEKEPPAADNPLLHMDHPERLFLTPHIAWSGREARETLVEVLRTNIDAFHKGEPQNAV